MGLQDLKSIVKRNEHIASERMRTIKRDLAKRDAWLAQNPSSSVLVSENVTLSDVHRWLKEAVVFDDMEAMA